MKKLLLFTLLIAAPYAAAYQETCLKADDKNVAGGPIVNFVGKTPAYWHFDYTETTHSCSPDSPKTSGCSTTTQCFLTFDKDEISALLTYLNSFSDNTEVSEILDRPLTGNLSDPLKRALKGLNKIWPYRPVGELKEKLKNPKHSL